MGRYVSFVDRFKKYISIDTKSDDASMTVPSTKGQLELGALLVQELTELGISAVHEPNGYVYAEIPATVQGKKTLGLIAQPLI